jgi:hypothetical protein
MPLWKTGKVRHQVERRPVEPPKGSALPFGPLAPLGSHEVGSLDGRATRSVIATGD